MNDAYPAIYRDAHGEERTTLYNDGKTLRMTVRGVEFAGDSLDALEPVEGNNPQRAAFAMDKWDHLIAASIVFDVPILTVAPEGMTTSTLSVQVDLEGAAGRDAGQYALPRLTLDYDGTQFSSASEWGCFETELLQIQRQLPPDVYMKCCFNCAYAGYDPAGAGLWGMFCHRNHKVEYLSAHDKTEWFRLNREAADFVQEIYLCMEFSHWNGRSGYRDRLRP